MADTFRGNFPKNVCSDCGNGDVFIKHWGPLVPSGEIGYFDAQCWTSRREYYYTTKEPLPLGHQLAKG